MRTLSAQILTFPIFEDERRKKGIKYLNIILLKRQYTVFFSDDDWKRAVTFRDVGGGCNQPYWWFMTRRKGRRDRIEPSEPFNFQHNTGAARFGKSVAAPHFLLRLMLRHKRKSALILTNSFNTL